MKIFFYLVLIVFFLTQSFAVQLVPMAKKDIKYKENINSSDLYYVAQSNEYSCKEYLKPNLLAQNLYKAKRYIIKNTPICQKDAVYEKPKIIRFKFGSLIIEKEGELLQETDEYIRIKNSDGKITKIYKDGRNN
jgi:hypothetical protein